MAGISKADREALAEVKRKFDSVDLNGNAEIADGLRKAFAKLAVEVHRVVPAGRNKSIAMTHLEDAAMRAIRGLAHDGGAPAGEEPVMHTDVVDQESTAPEQAATEMASSGPKRRGPRKRTAPKEVVEASV